MTTAPPLAPLTRTEAVSHALHFGFPRRHTHGMDEEFVELSDQQRAAADLIAPRIVAGEQTLIHGPLGRGKTFLVCAIGFTWYLRGRHRERGKARYYTSTRLLQLANDARSFKFQGENPMETARETGLLVLDQLLATHESVFDRKALTDMLDFRYNEQRPTLLVTNLDREGVIEALDGPAVDRLFENGKGIVELAGESRRTGQSMRGAKV